MSFLMRTASLLVLAVLPVRAQEPERPAHVRAWEHESSDLPVDPRFHFGHFDNGLRWVWARNSEPKERSYLRLHIDAGSLAEEESERGMAHFLEHMAFNGSEHFEPDTLVEWFQRHGVAFGADLNAHTGFSETVYELDLPDSDEKTLDEGLLVLRDFASGLSLSAEEIEKEKGVIDGEERERDSAGYRLFVRQLGALFGDTRLDDRIPIGVRETRAKFSPESVRAFYEKWYRPENATLVLVGDIGELDPLKLFEKHFAGWKRPDVALVAEPSAGTAKDFSHELCFFEPEIPRVTLQISQLRAYEDEPYDAAELREDAPVSAARAMIDLRLEELVKRADAPFLSASVDSARALRVFDGEELTISCAPERWKEALAVGDQELRRALQHGFQEAELAEVRANTLRSLDEAVERERTRTSAGLVGEILAAAEDRYVPTSAVTDRELLRPVVESLTVDACREALVEEWSKGELTLIAQGNLDLGADAATELEQALEASRAVDVAENEAIEVGDFAYASSSDVAGEIAERKHVEDLDFESVRFANGVALEVKRTDFREKQILFQVVLGEGQLSLATDATALAWMAERVFEEGGLEAHDIDALRRLLAGKQVSSGFSVGQDQFELSGATTKEDLVLQCELVCAYLQHAGWRDQGYLRVKRELPLVYEGLRHQHHGPIVMDFMGAIFSGDQRFMFHPQAVLEAVELGKVREWLAPFLVDAPLEVSFVGDLDVEMVISAAARTFGKLPQRRELRAYDEHRKAPSPKSGVHQVHSIDTEVPKSLVVTVFPVPDGIEAERRWRWSFLGEVVQDRLRVEVREKLGAAYAPGAGLQQSRVLPGVGLLLMQGMSEPSSADKLKEACLAVTDALAKDGVTEEEVARLREPILKELRDARRENGWWVGVLSEARRRPASLDEVRRQTAFYAGVTAAELTELAKTHLARERASSVIVHPRAAPEEAAAAPEEEGKDG